MKFTRRQVLGVAAATLVLRPHWLVAGDVVEITTGGRPNGSMVWFDPVGLRVEPGTTIRWTNRDKANVHTTTSYHPSLYGRQRRIPEGAEPWDSDYLLEGESFEITLSVPGIYDYYCVPHEHAGMVGRIVVGSLNPGDYPASVADPALTGLPDVALAKLQSIEAILATGQIRVE